MNDTEIEYWSFRSCHQKHGKDFMFIEGKI